MRNKMKKFIIFMMVLSLNSSVAAWAEEKVWTGTGTSTDWFDDANWLPADAPAVSDDALIDLTDASAAVSQDMNVKSITLGGKKASTLTMNNFVKGTVKPANTSDTAVLNRKGGLLVLKGTAEKITLKGGYKDSEEVIPEEPTFMLYVQ